MTGARSPVTSLGRHDSWEGVRAVVLGFGVSGFAAADNLLHLGASVIALSDTATPEQTERGELLEILGGDVRLRPGATAALPEGEIDVVVTSPGFRPTSPALVEAAARGIPVWGEVELAWRLRDLLAPGGPTPWLAVTGTNGKTTTVQMLDAILRRAGLRSIAAGNVGLPIVEAVMDPTPYDVMAVELSSFQLHHVDSMAAESAVVLNLAEDHLDWYGVSDGSGFPGRAAARDATAVTSAMRAYAADKARIYERVTDACVYNVADPATEEMVREADVTEGARAVGFTLGMPSVGMLGVVEDILVDRAFIEQRSSSAAELCTLADLAGSGGPSGPDGTGPAAHVVANALAAAALARSHGVGQAAVRDALRDFRLDGHRIALVAGPGDPGADGVRWIDDSKATNPHAARSSLLAWDHVVWIAGGLAKGAEFDDLVTRARGRLRGVVLIGRDGDRIAEALRRHAPDVPRVTVVAGETDGVDGGRALMQRVVTEAAHLAVAGDTVLLAPGCASQDQFADYAARGEAFAAAVKQRLHGSG